MAAAPAATCPICCDSINNGARKAIACAFCHEVACSVCVQRFLLTLDDPACMFATCRTPWTPDMVDGKLPKTFVLGPLKAHREDVLFNRERELLPATQTVMEGRAELVKMDEAIVAIEMQLRDARITRRDAARAVRGGGQRHQPDEERRKFVKQCPAEGCRGFLSTAYKCGLCECRVCPSCHEIKTEQERVHVCDPNAVASVEAIRSDCKSCPKCGTAIFRMFGCNQMFCTAPGCETAFDWVTGRILDHRTAHNPHLHAFLQSRAGGAAGVAGGAGGAAAGVPDGCARMPDVYRLMHVLMEPSYARSAPQLNQVVARKKYKWLLEIHRFVMHIVGSEMHRYPPAPDVIAPGTNLEARVEYLAGKLEEAQFKAMLQKREKARRRNDAIHQVLRTVVDVATDMFARVVRTGGSVEAIEDLRRDMDALVDFANEGLRAVARRYNCSVLFMDRETWYTPLRRVTVRAAAAAASVPEVQGVEAK